MSNARKNKGVAISLLKLLLGELETTEDLFSDSMSLEEHTFQIGRNAGKRMMLRLIRDLPLYSSQLDGVKIICKEFWHACFNKEANKLQTNYKDTFVIHSWYENSWSPLGPSRLPPRPPAQSSSDQRDFRRDDAPALLQERNLQRRPCHGGEGT